MNYIKSLIYTSLFSLGMFGVMSCQNDEDALSSYQSKDHLLKVSANIASDTRNVVTGTTFSEGDEIGIYIPGSTNLYAKYNGKQWNLNENYEVTSSMYINAIYPNCAAIDNDTRTKITIPRHWYDIDITPDAYIDGQADYMYGKSAEEVDVDNTTAYIVFKHALSRITLKINKGTNDIGSGVISKVRLRNYQALNSAISVKGQLDVYSGYITSNRDKDASIELLVNKTISENASCSIDILAMPTSFSDNEVEVVLTIDGSDYSFLLPASKWEKGQQYTYPITIERKTLHVEPAKIGDYYYSDGTWSTEYNETKTCIGIVFALSEEAHGDINVNLKESAHGRVVALSDAGEFAWGPIGDVEGIPNYTSSGGKYINCVLPIDGISEYYSSYADSPTRVSYNYNEWPTTKSLDCYLTDYDGRSHTSNMPNTSDYPIKQQLLKSAIYDYNQGYKNSSWYLPSIGEFARFVMAYRAGVISSSTHKEFKDLYNNYWTSSECVETYFSSDDEAQALTIHLNTGYIGPVSFTSYNGIHYSKQTKHKVRFITSF